MLFEDRPNPVQSHASYIKRDTAMIPKILGISSAQNSLLTPVTQSSISLIPRARREFTISPDTFPLNFFIAIPIRGPMALSF